MANIKNICNVGVNLFKNIKINRNLTIVNKNSQINFSTSTVLCDQVTHTGQKWEDDDYRNVRFVETPKQVNPNFAYNLIEQVPVAASNKRVVWCDGGGGPTGHPKVYINLDKPGNHICGYCGLRFFKDGSHAH